LASLPERVNRRGPMSAAIAAFLLGFPALFSIVNAPGGAFIFNEVTSHLGRGDRARIAGRVGLYSLGVMLGALWFGAYILNFFGISLAALRLAGGVVVAAHAWGLLSAPERQEARKQEQAESGGPAGDDLAFFPLTLPFTTGPGTISVAVALGAGRPAAFDQLVWFFLGMTAAAAAMAACIWVFYRSADRVAGLVGTTARRTIARLSAFLLLCIGTQIMLAGVEEVARGLR
jgi:multiple antibiotic resistance protein